MSAEAAHEPGPKYYIDVEGDDKAWDKDTITVAQIRDLAGWDASQQVVEVDLEDNSERTLGESDVIDLKPGKGFAKKIRFKRG